MKDDPIVIVAAKRTPMGAMQGVFSGTSAPELAAATIQGIVEESKIDPKLIEEVIIGNVLPAGIGQAPARQAAIKAGLPTSTACTTVNKVCGSGLEAVMMAHDFILAGRHKVIVAGGMENMTRAPYMMLKGRAGYKLGNNVLYDHMFLDGLEDPYQKKMMGEFGEITAEKYGFTREQQDAFAIASLKRAQEAVHSGAFEPEITPIVVEHDEVPMCFDIEKIPKLRPVFRKNGTLTAANSSSIADGAATVMLMKKSKADELGIKPLACIVGHMVHAQEPEWFTTAPTFAIQKLLDKLSWKVSDVDLFEINEAFAVVAMATLQDLKIPEDKVNIRGGACALGHPLGASGARILVTLIHALKDTKKKRGLASLCLGGGEAVAIAVEVL